MVLEWTEGPGQDPVILGTQLTTLAYTYRVGIGNPTTPEGE